MRRSVVVVSSGAATCAVYGVVTREFASVRPKMFFFFTKIIFGL